jgi:hypothetical protein
MGALLIVLSVPGMLAPVSTGDWAYGLPWLPVALAVFSSLLFVLGVSLLWQGIRGALRFGPSARWRLRRGR